MADEQGSGRSLGMPEAAELRGKTEAISKHLQAHLEGHLETLRTLFAPRRLLGRHLGGSAGRDEVSGADQALAELERCYKEAVGPPFVLRGTLRKELLTGMDNRVALHPWEYDHEIASGSEKRTIHITSPVRWVMTYASDYTYAGVRRALAGEAEKRTDDLAQFAVNALVMRALLDQFPALVQLLADLRFEVSVETPPGLGKLPVVTVRSNLASFRPADDLVLTATGFSGVSAFIELVDRDAVENLRDPLREELLQLLG